MCSIGFSLLRTTTSVRIFHSALLLFGVSGFPTPINRYHDTRTDTRGLAFIERVRTRVRYSRPVVFIFRPFPILFRGTETPVKIRVLLFRYSSRLGRALFSDVPSTGRIMSRNAFTFLAQHPSGRSWRSFIPLPAAGPGTRSRDDGPSEKHHRTYMFSRGETVGRTSTIVLFGFRLGFGIGFVLSFGLWPNVYEKRFLKRYLKADWRRRDVCLRVKLRISGTSIGHEKRRD